MEERNRVTHWASHCVGGGIIEQQGESWHLAMPATSTARYVDAQLDDGAGENDHVRQVWRPPLRLVLRARASHAAAIQNDPATDGLLGTAGFGFWNEPFMQAKLTLRLPEAVWFLYTSPPSQLALVPGLPRYGWKAQIVHAQRFGAVLAGLPALATLGWARLSRREDPAARWVQRVSGAREAMIAADLAQWHEYRLDWRRESAAFFVDGQPLCRLPNPPSGPLHFVAWIDNQFAIVTPRGTFRSGVLRTGPQWLDLDQIAMTPLTPAEAR